MTPEAQPGPARPSGAPWPAFAALALLTTAELAVAAGSGPPRIRVTALAGLLIAKLGLVLAGCLRVDVRRAPPRLPLAALVLAAGAVVVLMLEAVFEVRVR